MNKFFNFIACLQDWDLLLRTVGILTFQYNPERDVLERKYHLIGFTLNGKEKAFSTRHPLSRLLTKQREAIEVSRPGVYMRFDNLLDFNRRMYQLAEHEGYKVAPYASWVVTNVNTGVHKLIPSNWPYNRKIMVEGFARVPEAYAA